MARWTDGKLDLGKLGELFVHRDPDGMYAWGLDYGTALFFKGEDRYAAESAAQRVAEKWLRAALQQAAQRIEE